MAGPFDTPLAGLTVVTAPVIPLAGRIARAGYHIVTRPFTVAPHSFPSVGVTVTDAVTGPKFAYRSGVHVVSTPIRDKSWYAYSRVVAALPS